MTEQIIAMTGSQAASHIEDTEFHDYNVRNPNMLTGETVSAT